MSSDRPELELLRAREHDIGAHIAQATRDLSALEQEIARLEDRVPELRARLDKQRIARESRVYPVPVKIFLSVLLAPVGALLGVVSGLFACSFLALPALALGLRSDLGLPLLIVGMAAFALLGLGCMLLSLWED